MLLDTINAAGIAANSGIGTFHARIVVRPDGKLLTGTESLQEKEAVELRKDKWSIIYRPRDDQPKFRGKPYILQSPDIMKLRARYVDWEDLKAESEHEEFLKWLMRWGDLSEKTFEVARRNIGYGIPVAIDLIRYDEHLQELYRQETGAEEYGQGLLGFPHYGEISAFAANEYKKVEYENSIARKTKGQKSGKKQ